MGGGGTKQAVLTHGSSLPAQCLSSAALDCLHAQLDVFKGHFVPQLIGSEMQESEDRGLLPNPAPDSKTVFVFRVMKTEKPRLEVSHSIQICRI